MEPVFLDWNQLVIDPLMVMVRGAVAFIPNIISSVLIIFMGLVLAILAREILGAFLKSVGFDGFSDRINLFPGSKEEGEGKLHPHQYAARWVYWIVLLSVIVAVFDRLRLQAVSLHIDAVVGFAVTVFVASMIAVVGLFLSMLAHRVVLATAGSVGFAKPELLANAAKWAVVFSTAIICLFQISIPREIILIILGATYLTLCVTFVLAFGIGGTGFAATVLSKLTDSRK
jgi:hypothetical protein